MTYVSCGLIVVCLYLVWALLERDRRAREERRELEDRLMAICQPIPLTQVMSDREKMPAEISYVDTELQGRTTAKLRGDE